MYFIVVFFFKQKTAYEMRISDWSSDVCSSDLLLFAGEAIAPMGRSYRVVIAVAGGLPAASPEQPGRHAQHHHRRRQVGQPVVEPVHTRQLHELHLQQPEAEREHDPDEQPLARAAAAQGAEGERDRRQAQGQHVERVEPAAPVMLLELAGIQAVALPVVDAAAQVARGHVARARSGERRAGKEWVSTWSSR